MVVSIDSTSQVIDDRQPTPKASNASLTPPPKSSTSSSVKTSPTSNRTTTTTTPQRTPQQQQTKTHIISGGTAPAHGTSSFNPSSTLPRCATVGSKNEEFKNQLVHDVFGRDNKGKVPMEKVAMLIWQFRDDPAVVQFMAQFVAKVRYIVFIIWYDFVLL